MDSLERIAAEYSSRSRADARNPDRRIPDDGNTLTRANSHRRGRPRKAAPEKSENGRVSGGDATEAVKPTVFKAKGNGRLDAVSNAIQENTDVRYTDLTYSEHALEIGSTSRAMAYIGVTGTDGKITWGAGMDTDIITASVMALFSAINRMVKK